MSTHEPDFSALAQAIVQDLPPRPTEAEVQGCIFDLRRMMVDMLLSAHLKEGEEGEEDAKEASDDPALVRRQDILRDALPPLSVEPGPYVRVFSVWRSAVVAVLGLLLGQACAQGLVRAVPDMAVGGGLTLLCALGGAMLSLTLACALQKLDAASLASSLSAAFSALPSLPASPLVSRLGGWLKLGTLRRRFFWLWGAALFLTLARDFFAGRDALGLLLEMVGAFLFRGDALALWGSAYGALIALGCFALCVRQPLLLHKKAFAQHLTLAASNWWGGAHCAARALAENTLLRHHDRLRQWRQVGSDLYSLAGELPPARREWMEERLRRLGLEAPRKEGLLVWSQALSERYDVLGHMEVGDMCYVDEPPLLEKGCLLRKGTLRKVRK